MADTPTLSRAVKRAPAALFPPRANAAQTAADRRAWSQARAQALQALQGAPLGSVFVTAAQGVDGSWTVVVGTANNDLKRHESERLRAAVIHLTTMFNAAPAGYPQPQAAPEQPEQEEAAPTPSIKVAKPA